MCIYILSLPEDYGWLSGTLFTLHTLFFFSKHISHPNLFPSNFFFFLFHGFHYSRRPLQRRQKEAMGSLRRRDSRSLEENPCLVRHFRHPWRSRPRLRRRRQIPPRLQSQNQLPSASLRRSLSRPQRLRSHQPLYHLAHIRHRRRYDPHRHSFDPRRFPPARRRSKRPL